MARRQIKRPVYKTVLLVVEGETEQIYFERLKALEKYQNLRIRPEMPKHSNIGTLLEYAKKEAKSKAYDSVWLLFDRDVLKTQNIHKDILKQINDEKAINNLGIKLADSFPCFEVWFLLHYCVPQNYYNSQNELIKELRKYLPEYTKNNAWLDKNDIYKLLRSKINDAFINSNILRSRKNNYGFLDATMCNIDLLMNEIASLAGTKIYNNGKKTMTKLDELIASGSKTVKPKKRKAND